MNAPLRVPIVSSVLGIDASSLRGSWAAYRPRKGDSAAARNSSLGRPHGLAWCSAGQRFAGLEQRLQAAEDVHPAGAGDALGGLRCALELVVDDGKERGPVFLLLDLPGDAARLLGGELVGVARDPAVHELPGRILLQHLLV